MARVTVFRVKDGKRSTDVFNNAKYHDFYAYVGDVRFRLEQPIKYDKETGYFATFRNVENSDDVFERLLA